MRFVLHIGPHKTGTSYIQLECATRRNELLEKGILYPQTWNRELSAHDAIYHQLRQGHYEFFSANFEAAVAESRSNTEVMLLSTENMEYFEGDAIEILAQHFPPERTNIVYYIRAWPALLCSIWQERIKHGATLTFPEHALEHLGNPDASSVLNYDIVLSRYAKVYGAEQIAVRVYDNIMESGGDVFEDLISVCLDTPSPLTGSRVKENLSLATVDIEAIRLLNLMMLGSGGTTSTDVRERYLARYRNAPLMERLRTEFEIIAAPYCRKLELSPCTPNFRKIEAEVIRRYRNVGPCRRLDRLFNEQRGVAAVHYSSALLADEKVRDVLRQMAAELRQPAEPTLGAGGGAPSSGSAVSAGERPAPEPWRPTIEIPFDGAGMAMLTAEPVGFFPDGWVRAHAVLRCHALQTVTCVSLQIWVPPGDKPLGMTLRAPGDGGVTLPAPADIGSILQFPVHVARGAEFTVEVIADREAQLSETDRRRAAYVIGSISFA